MRNIVAVLNAGFILLVLGVGACRSADRTAMPERDGSAITLAPAMMAPADTVDDRYQSYNVEMLEVTGGKFWKPYGAELDSLLQAKPPAGPSASNDTPAGMNPALYSYRPPIDLTNPRLRKLAAALGPAYVRVSGTWANTTYFPPSDEAPNTPPAGFNGVLTRQQWKGVIDFAKTVNAEIVTSFATSPGTRKGGVWTPEQARRLIDYTRSVGGRIAAAEYMNEPTLAVMGGAPAGYDAAAYGRDFKLFRAFAKQVAPDMLVLGPGSVGETTGDWGVSYGSAGLLATRDLLAASRPATVDAFSYHHYGTASLRCAGTGAMPQTTASAALSEEWLKRTEETLAFYRPLRDEFAPGTPFWNTETADAACGGNPWGSTFLDSFRYLDQLGRLAKQEVRVVAHNTLVASDYGLLDDRTLEPKPNYWAAVLWRKLMGPVVLESSIPIRAGLHLYAHCLHGVPGGVALLAIHTDTDEVATLTLPTPAERYTLSSSSPDLQVRKVQLNGTELKLGANEELPRLAGIPEPAGEVSLAPATITFLALPQAANGACR
jgi:heparanase 1